MFWIAISLATQSQVADSPRLDEVMALPPHQAGSLLLNGRERASVTQIKVDKHPLDPPGFTQLDLVEEPIKITGGCSQQHWVAKFFSRADHSNRSVLYGEPYYYSTVALSSTDYCGPGQYVRLNPGVKEGEAVTLLHALKKIISGETKAHIECKTRVNDGLCRSKKTILKELKSLKIWALSKKKDNAEFWLGTPGQVVTSVSFNPKNSGKITVLRKIPAPF